MTMTVADKVKQIIIEQIGVAEDEVTPEAGIIVDLGADSLDAIEIVMECEDAFGLEISDEDVAKLLRVGEIVSYIEGRLTKNK